MSDNTPLTPPAPPISGPPASPPTATSHSSASPASSARTAAPAAVPASASWNLTNWLTAQRNLGVTPDVIAQRLVANGWSGDTAARTALTSLRNADRHRLIYSGLCWGAGITALALATAIHLILGRTQSAMGTWEREYLAFLITTVVILAPITITCGVFANRIEATDPFAIWSPTRRSLFGLLAGCTATVGLIRLLSYTYSLVASITGAHERLDGAQLVQVLVSLSIAVPLFAWSLLEWRRSNVAIRSLATSETSTSGHNPTNRLAR